MSEEPPVPRRSAEVNKWSARQKRESIKQRLEDKARSRGISVRKVLEERNRTFGGHIVFMPEEGSTTTRFADLLKKLRIKHR
jgi:hypothetical protein